MMHGPTKVKSIFIV